MAKVRVLGTPFSDGRVQPTGLVDGQPWAEIGEEMELDDGTAESLAEAGTVELVDGRKVEKRPARSTKTETR